MNNAYQINYKNLLKVNFNRNSKTAVVSFWFFLFQTLNKYQMASLHSTSFFSVFFFI